MSTTTQLKVMKNMPYQLRARADGKWDYTASQAFTTEGQSVSVNMTAYNGLSMDYEESYQSADKVDFSNTVLPWKWQYSTALTTDRYCLMPAGQNYDNILDATLTANYDVVGSPTISSEYVASGFSASSYLKLKEPFNPNGSWELTTKIHTASSNTSLQGIYHSLRDASSANGKFGVTILLTTDRHFELAVSANGSSWLFDIAGTYTFNNNTDYFIKIGWTGTEYYLKYSTDGSSWVDDITYASSTPIYALNVDSFLGIFHSGTNKYPFSGKIDLMETYIDQNGVRYWSAVERDKETLPGCTYNFTDDGSATTLNCFVVNGDEGIVLTPDNSYGTSRLLGTVSIPSHTVYEYNNGTWTEIE